MTQSDAFMGDKVVVELKIANKSAEDRLINGHLVVSSMYYTGVHHKDIMKQKVDDMILKPNEGKTFYIRIESHQTKAGRLDRGFEMASKIGPHTHYNLIRLCASQPYFRFVSSFPRRDIKWIIGFRTRLPFSKFGFIVEKCPQMRRKRSQLILISRY